MERMTFTVPAELKKRLQAREDINWSNVVAKALQERLDALEFMDRVLAKSRLTQEDVDEIADKINTGMAKRLGLIE